MAAGRGSRWIFRRLAELARRAGRDALLLLDQSESDPKAWLPVDYSPGQGGTRPRRLDRSLHAAWREGLEGRWGGRGSLTVLGEEAGEDDFEAVPVGGYVALVDALDGTGNWTALGFGAAMSAVFLRRLAGEFAFASVSVIEIGQRRHWWTDDMSTWVGGVDEPVSADGIKTFTGPPGSETREGDALTDVTRWTIGGVGAKHGPTRNFLDFLTAQRGMPTVTLGGLPLASAVFDRELVALVECKHTTVYDSAHLPVAAFTGAVIGTLDGERLGPGAVQEVFSRVSKPKERVVPPYILAKDAYYYQELVQVYRDFTGTS